MEIRIQLTNERITEHLPPPSAALGAWGLTMGLFIVWLLGVLRM